MPRKGYKFTPEQIENVRKGHLGQRAWNTGTGGCKKGHDPTLYVEMPSGVYVCLGCTRENGAKYREANREKIRISGRAARYGMSVAELKAMHVKQNNACAVCGASFDDVTCRIDHDHDTGKVRELLCASCNTALGLFKDSPDILRKAARYLEKHDGNKGNNDSST